MFAAVGLIALPALGRAHPLTGAPHCEVFPSNNPWNERVDRLPVARDSQTLIATIGLDESTYIFAEQPAWTKQPFVQRVMHPSVRALLDDPAYRERTLAATGTGKARAAVANNKHGVLRWIMSRW